MLHKFEIKIWPPSFASDYYCWQFHSVPFCFCEVQFMACSFRCFINGVWNGEKSNTIYLHSFTF